MGTTLSEKPVLLTRSRKGTISSKIGKLLGVSKNGEEVGIGKDESVKGFKEKDGDTTPPSPTSASSLPSPRGSSTTLGKYQVETQSLNSSSNCSSRVSSTNNLGQTLNLADKNNGQSQSQHSQANGINHQAGVQCSRRFVVHEDGTHEHHLKNAKRQEKLGSMIRNMLGAQKIRGKAKSAVPEVLIKSMKNGDPPSLFSGLISQVDASDIGGSFPYSGATQSQDQKQMYFKNQGGSTAERLKELEDAVNPLHENSLSFGEKYGRCQEVIGKGSFGVVRICHKRDSNEAGREKLYAVKEFKRKATEDPTKFSKRLTSEFCISSSLKHTNIIDTLDLFQDAKGDYCEVMEYCSGGDLYTLIIAAGKLEYQEADCFFRQLLTGVVFMHNMGVCHRDLKPENLLLTHDGILKITDFGNGECFKMAWENEIHLSGGVCGSSPYIAPEEYTHEEFDPRAVDIWACGVIYMAMRTGRQLWRTAQKEDEFYMRYLKGRKNEAGYEPIEQLKRARCRNVIYSVLDPVPSRRLTGSQILNSEWGREIKCCHEGHPYQVSDKSRY